MYGYALYNFYVVNNVPIDRLETIYKETINPVASLGFISVSKRCQIYFVYCFL
jgi:hypothetical protein